MKTLRDSVFPGLAVLFSCWTLSALQAKERVKRIHADLGELRYVSPLSGKDFKCYSCKENLLGRKPSVAAAGTPN